MGLCGAQVQMSAGFRDVLGADAGLSGEDVDRELQQLRRLEVASVAEAGTLILLVLVAVPLKHLAGWETGVRIMGPVHGMAFLAYVWTLIQTMSGSSGAWSRLDIARLVLAALVPFGAIANLRLLARKRAGIRARIVPA
jgi:integral membrane protein